MEWALLGLVCGIAVLFGGLWWRTKQQAEALRLRLMSLEGMTTQGEKHLKTTARLQEGLLRVITDSILVLDKDQRIILTNEAAQRLLGEKLMGETLISITRNTDLEALVKEALASPNSGELPERILEMNQANIRARASCVADNGEILVVLLLHNETELLRLNRARRDMVANISHELRTPITTIGLLADTLLTGVLKKSKRSRKMVSDIRREVDTLTQLVQEMRDLSLIESGQMPVKMTPVSLLWIMQMSAESLYSLAERKEQQLILDIDPDLTVLADANQIQRVVKNIIHNGIKFAPQGGWIKAEATPKGDEVMIAISNNGPGIAPEDLPRIFERFYQADRARSDGTGLGLAIARHIILSHGGRIWAESQAGAGATFYLTLALVEQTIIAD